MSENKTEVKARIMPAEDGSIKVVFFSAPTSPPLLGAKAASGAKNAPVEDVTVTESGAEAPLDESILKQDLAAEEATAAETVDSDRAKAMFAAHKPSADAVFWSKFERPTDPPPAPPSSMTPSARTALPVQRPCMATNPRRTVQGAVHETEPTSTRSGFRFGKFCSTSKLLCIFFTVAIGLGCSAFALSSYGSGGVSELLEAVSVPDVAAIPVVDFSNTTPVFGLNPTSRGTTFAPFVDADPLKCTGWPCCKTARGFGLCSASLDDYDEPDKSEVSGVQNFCADTCACDSELTPEECNDVAGGEYLSAIPARYAGIFNAACDSEPTAPCCDGYDLDRIELKERRPQRRLKSKLDCGVTSTSVTIASNESCSGVEWLSGRICTPAQERDFKRRFSSQILHLLNEEGYRSKINDLLSSLLKPISYDGTDHNGNDEVITEIKNAPILPVCLPCAPSVLPHTGFQDPVCKVYNDGILICGAMGGIGKLIDADKNVGTNMEFRLNSYGGLDGLSLTEFTNDEVGARVAGRSLPTFSLNLTAKVVSTKKKLHGGGVPTDAHLAPWGRGSATLRFYGCDENQLSSFDTQWQAQAYAEAEVTIDATATYDPTCGFKLTVDKLSLVFEGGSKFIQDATKLSSGEWGGKWKPPDSTRVWVPPVLFVPGYWIPNPAGGTDCPSKIQSVLNGFLSSSVEELLGTDELLGTTLAAEILLKGVVASALGPVLKSTFNDALTCMALDGDIFEEIVQDAISNAERLAQDCARRCKSPLLDRRILKALEDADMASDQPQVKEGIAAYVEGMDKCFDYRVIAEVAKAKSVDLKCSQLKLLSRGENKCDCGTCCLS